MGARTRDQSAEALNQRLRAVDDVRGAVGEGALEAEGDAAVGQDLEAVVGERRSRDVPDEPLERVASARGDRHPGVEVEAPEAGLKWDAPLPRGRVGDGTQARHPLPGPLPEG